MPLIRYVSNNSGGIWWLDDEDWYALEKAGWNVLWVKDEPYYKKHLDSNGRYLDCLATQASKHFPNVEDAIDEWETVTKANAYADGCSTCGEPHSFDILKDEDN